MPRYPVVLLTVLKLICVSGLLVGDSKQMSVLSSLMKCNLVSLVYGTVRNR